MAINRPYQRQFSTFRKLSYGNSDSAEAADIPDDFGNQDSPKLKFLFTVTFDFRTSLRLFGGEEFDEVEFGLKQATRPNPTINYQDVNMYNFRTKVATSMDYGSVNFILYDDNKNRAHALYEHYLKHVSPIANIPRDNADVLDRVEQGSQRNEPRGPVNNLFNTQQFVLGRNNLSSPLVVEGSGSGSIGPLPSDLDASGGRLGLIRSIRLTHHFWQYRNIGTGRVNYDFLNPKITNMSLDELDMSQSEANMLTLTFNYDAVNIVAENFDSQIPGVYSISDVENANERFGELLQRDLNISSSQTAPRSGS